MSKITAQKYADEIVAPEYRQPLKTLAECLDAQGWDHLDHPTCCGVPLEIRGFIGSPYFVQCKICKKFAVDVLCPSFRNGHVLLPDTDKIKAPENDATWICGTEIQQ